MTDFNEKHFITSDNVRLSYRVGGDPRGKPLLFCYGLLCSGFHFNYQWQHFARSHRLLMLDYRGHHVSDFPEALTTLNFKRLANDLHELLAHEKITMPATVVGHSMGVNVALELYERHPEDVAALVLMAGAATFPARNRAELERIAFVAASLKIIDGLSPRAADVLWRKLAGLPGTDRIAGFVGFNTSLAKNEDIRRVVQEMSGFSPRVFLQLLGEYVRHDRRDTLSRVKVPTLVLSGTLDKAVPPRFQDDLAVGIRASRLVRIEGGSHCPQFDKPVEVSSAIEDFLRSCEEQKQKASESARAQAPSSTRPARQPA